MKVSQLQDQLTRLRESFGDAEVHASTGPGSTLLDVTGISFTITAGESDPQELVLVIAAPAPSSAPETPQVTSGPLTPGGTP